MKGNNSRLTVYLHSATIRLPIGRLAGATLAQNKPFTSVYAVLRRIAAAVLYCASFEEKPDMASRQYLICR